MGTHPIFESDFDCLTDEARDVKMSVGVSGNVPRLSISTILNDKLHLEYFREFLNFKDQRLITLHREIRKFRCNVPNVPHSTNTEEENSEKRTDQEAEDIIRDQLLYSALSNVSEITKDAVNVCKRTSEELNGEAQRIIRNYGDILEWRDGENSRVVIEFRKKLEKGIVKDEDLENIEDFIECILEKKAIDFGKSKHYKALMVEVFTDKALSLDNLLSYEPMHSTFEEFMKHEKSMDVLSFYLMSCDFRVRYDQMKDADRVNYSRQLYQKLENLGFSENVKTQIANEMKKLKQNSFELPVRQALTTLQTVYLPLFLRSSNYRDLLNQLIQEAGLIKSEIEQKHKDNLSNDLSTYHPESIYFRPLSGHLYLGHIDSLGRYRSETQSGPLAKLLISKEKKSFTITFKSWGQSQKDNEKAEEEAWKTARMIIADIISFTTK